MIKYIFGKLFDVQYFSIYWMLEIYNLFWKTFTIYIMLYVVILFCFIVAARRFYCQLDESLLMRLFIQGLNLAFK